MKKRLNDIKQKFTWHRRLKSLNIMGASIFRVQALIIGKIIPVAVKANFVFISRLLFLFKKNGLGQTAKYLKACHVITMRFVSGYTADLHSSTFDPRVSLTHGGLPRIIPSYYRNLIRDKNVSSIR